MRTRHRWDVAVHARTGDTVTERVEAFWDPEHETTGEAVQIAGMVQAWVRAGKPTEKAHDAFAPVAAKLVTA